MTITFRLQYNDNGHRSLFRDMPCGEDGYALEEGDGRRLLWEPVCPVLSSPVTRQPRSKFNSHTEQECCGTRETEDRGFDTVQCGIPLLGDISSTANCFIIAVSWKRNTNLYPLFDVCYRKCTNLKTSVTTVNKSKGFQAYYGFILDNEK